MTFGIKPLLVLFLWHKHLFGRKFVVCLQSPQEFQAYKNFMMIEFIVQMNTFLSNIKIVILIHFDGLPLNRNYYYIIYSFDNNCFTTHRLFVFATRSKTWRYKIMQKIDWPSSIFVLKLCNYLKFAISVTLMTNELLRPLFNNSGSENWSNCHLNLQTK